MSLSTPAPNSLLSRLDAAGNPYHGLVDNGTITLPNSETMAHPTPTGVWYMSGRSIRVERPGWTAPARTEDQQAADTAAGYQWMGYGIMAGEGALFYGQPLGDGNWIYIDPDGARWLVEYIVPPEQTLGTLQGLAVTIRLSRFGEFGVDPDVHDYAVTVPDLGQSAPVWEGFGSSSRWLDRLMDAKPDGSGAVIMVYQRVGDAAYVRDAALAFVEITLSGAGASVTASMVLRRNRAQCVGVVTQDPWPSAASSVQLDASSRGVVSAPISGLYFVGTSSQEYNNYSFSSCSGGSRSVASLSLVKSIHWSDGLSPAVPEGSFPRFLFYEYAGDINAQRIGVIASMFYGPDGALREITADFVMNWTISNPSVSSPTGPTVARETDASGAPGACTNVVTLDEIGSISYSQSTSVSGSFGLTIRSGGVVCYEKTFTGTESGTFSETIDYKAHPSPDVNFPVTRATRSVVTARAYTSSNGSSQENRSDTQQSSGWPNFNSGAPSYEGSIRSIPGIYPWHLRRESVSTFDGTGNVLTSPDLQMYDIFGNQATTTPPLGEPAVISGNPARVFVQLVRLGPAILGVLESTIPNTNLGENYQAVFSGLMATPGGAVSLADVVAPTMILAANPYPQSPLRASYHPVTGEIARSFNAVCWV